MVDTGIQYDEEQAKKVKKTAGLVPDELRGEIISPLFDMVTKAIEDVEKESPTSPDDEKSPLEGISKSNIEKIKEIGVTFDPLAREGIAHIPNDIQANAKKVIEELNKFQQDNDKLALEAARRERDTKKEWLKFIAKDGVPPEEDFPAVIELAEEELEEVTKQLESLQKLIKEFYENKDEEEIDLEEGMETARKYGEAKSELQEKQKFLEEQIGQLNTPGVGVEGVIEATIESIEDLKHVIAAKRALVEKPPQRSATLTAETLGEFFNRYENIIKEAGVDFEMRFEQSFSSLNWDPISLLKNCGFTNTSEAGKKEMHIKHVGYDFMKRVCAKATEKVEKWHKLFPQSPNAVSIIQNNLQFIELLENEFPERAMNVEAFSILGCMFKDLGAVWEGTTALFLGIDPQQDPYKDKVSGFLAKEIMLNVLDDMEASPAGLSGEHRKLLESVTGVTMRNVIYHNDPEKDLSNVNGKRLQDFHQATLAGFDGMVSILLRQGTMKTFNIGAPPATRDEARMMLYNLPDTSPSYCLFDVVNTSMRKAAKAVVNTRSQETVQFTKDQLKKTLNCTTLLCLGHDIAERAAVLREILAWEDHVNNCDGTVFGKIARGFKYTLRKVREKIGGGFRSGEFGTRRRREKRIHKDKSVGSWLSRKIHEAHSASATAEERRYKRVQAFFRDIVGKCEELAVLGRKVEEASKTDRTEEVKNYIAKRRELLELLNKGFKDKEVHGIEKVFEHRGLNIHSVADNTMFTPKFVVQEQCSMNLDLANLMYTVMHAAEMFNFKGEFREGERMTHRMKTGKTVYIRSEYFEVDLFNIMFGSAYGRDKDDGTPNPEAEDGVQMVRGDQHTDGHRTLFNNVEIDHQAIYSPLKLWTMPDEEGREPSVQEVKRRAKETLIEFFETIMMTSLCGGYQYFGSELERRHGKLLDRIDDYIENWDPEEDPNEALFINPSNFLSFAAYAFQSRFEELNKHIDDYTDKIVSAAHCEQVTFADFYNTQLNSLYRIQFPGEEVPSNPTERAAQLKLQYQNELEHLRAYFTALK